jgi:hypothetical protein
MDLSPVPGASTGENDPRHLGVSFTIEKLADCLAEGLPLLQRNWEETGEFGETLKFDPDIDLYRRMEKNGFLNILIARREQKMIGYALLVIQPNLKHRGLYSCIIDPFYLLPDWRTGRTALRMISEAIQFSYRRGARFWTINSNLRVDFSRLLQRIGFREVDLVLAATCDTLGIEVGDGN